EYRCCHSGCPPPGMREYRNAHLRIHTAQGYRGGNPARFADEYGSAECRSPLYRWWNDNTRPDEAGCRTASTIDRPDGQVQSGILPMDAKDSATISVRGAEERGRYSV